MSTWEPIITNLSQDARFSEDNITDDFLQYLAQELQSTMRQLFGPDGPYYHAIPVFPYFVFSPCPAFQLIVETLLVFRTEHNWFFIELTPSPDKNPELLELYQAMHAALTTRNLIPTPVLFFSPLLGDYIEAARSAARQLHWQITDIEEKTTHVIFPPPLNVPSLRTDSGSLSVPGFPSPTVGVTLDWLLDSARLNEWQNEADYPANAAPKVAPPPPPPKKEEIPSEDVQEAGTVRRATVEEAPQIKLEKLQEEVEEEDRQRDLVLPVLPEQSVWFSIESVNEIEQEAFPEFFDEKKKSKSAEMYVYYRNFMVAAWRERPAEYMTFTSIRRCLAGDIGCLQRIFNFLEYWNIINYKVVYPTFRRPEARPAVREHELLGKSLEVNESLSKDFPFDVKKEYLDTIPNHYLKIETQWSREEMALLMQGIKDYPDDWEKVSEMTGKTASECVEKFLTLQIEDPFVGREFKGQISRDFSDSRDPDLIRLSKELIKRIPNDLSKRIGEAVFNICEEFNSGDLKVNNADAEFIAGISVNSWFKLKQEEDELRNSIMKALELQMKSYEAKQKIVEHSLLVLDQERADLDRQKRIFLHERAEFKKQVLSKTHNTET
ncbi:hypothetical protein GEMRC1_005521 [Eukaryota sp. GEM-RC1]